jgi:ABC-type dipeptide/oligopeptide/nickel transport system ATPase component
MLLDIRDLTITAGGSPVVRDVSLTVAENESVGVVGESGSGKTLTTRAVPRLLPPGVRCSAGTITFGSQEIGSLGKRDLRSIRGRDIGYIPQDPLTSLNPLLPVGEQITEVVRAHAPVRSRLLADLAEVAAGMGLRVRRRQMLEQAAAMLEQVGIAEPYERARQYPGAFSGGMRQRAVIAAAIALKPALLIADEPTTALDATVERGVLDLLRGLRASQGMSLLLVSHDLDVIGWMCDRAYVMYHGRIMESAPVTVLLSEPRHPYTAALVESSRLVKGESGGGTPAGDSAGSAGPAGSAGSARAPAECPFAPLCPRALPVCRTEPLPRTAAGPGHEHWCHNPLPGRAAA